MGTHVLEARLSTDGPTAGVQIVRILILVLLLLQIASAQAPENGDDLSTVDGVLEALYDVISGPPGPRDWNRMRGLFHADARLTALPAKGQAIERISVDQYIERYGPVLQERGFFEREVARATERYGRLVHVFSTYESRLTADGQPFTRGINSIQLARAEARWVILNVTWEDERISGPIPERYLAETRPALDGLLTPIRELRGVPALAVAVVRDGQVIDSGVVGVRKSDDPTPAKLDDRFHIGSDTKAMTAVLAAMMVERGQLRWDSTLAEVLPKLAKDVLEPYRGVTLKDLLLHRGGLCHHVPKGIALARLFHLPGNDIHAKRLEYLKICCGVPPVAEPGTATSYSNAGYVAVGAMIEAVARRSWEDVITTELFEPLGIKSAGFGAAGSLGDVSQPWPHRVADGETVPIPPSPNADNAPVIGPAGRVHLSIRDWGRFVALFVGLERREPLLSEASRAALLDTSVDGSFAMGWGKLPDGHDLGPAMVHSGSNTMNFAVAWIAPEEQLAVVVATNQGGPEADGACRDALRAVLERHRGKSDQLKVR